MDQGDLLGGNIFGFPSSFLFNKWEKVGKTGIYSWHNAISLF